MSMTIKQMILADAQYTLVEGPVGVVLDGCGAGAINPCI